jgi:hypothetical protein
MKFHSYYSNVEPTVDRIMCLHNLIGLLDDLDVVDKSMSLGYYHGDVYYFFITFESDDRIDKYDVALGPGYYRDNP